MNELGGIKEKLNTRKENESRSRSRSPRARSEGLSALEGKFTICNEKIMILLASANEPGKVFFVGRKKIEFNPGQNSVG